MKVLDNRGLGIDVVQFAKWRPKKIVRVSPPVARVEVGS